MMKLLIDCDPGVDDSIAILFALNRKDVEVVGISTGVGNVSVQQGTDNLLRILKLAGLEGKMTCCCKAMAQMYQYNVSGAVGTYGQEGGP